jgi:hydroxymethylpyrimidine pyrophosphatase-like HAD family hydrolase
MIVKIKNSEVFKLPVNGVAMGISNEAIKQDFDDGVTPWDVIDRSVNEFDRLTEENKRLRDALEDCINSLDRSYDAIDWPANGTSKQEISSKMAKQLLAELKGSEEVDGDK